MLHASRSVRVLSVRRFTRGLSFTPSRYAVLPPKESTVKKFAFPKHTHTVEDINASLSSLWGQRVTLSGWVEKKPKKLGKSIVFATLRDFEGNTTQILAREEHVDSLRSAQVEDCVAITGIIEKRHSKGDDAEERWDLVVDEYTTLNDSSVIPAQLESLKKTPQDWPQQYRFLQLRLPSYQDALKKRALAAQIIRSTLIEKSFTEIETPLLFKSTPEGAREFLVPTRRHDKFYALPQSPQQYKQLLMASGVKNYFQLARCFRDEDLRADRQPEFTQVDLEMSFADMKDVQDVVEGTVKQVWEQVANEKIVTVDGDAGVKDGDLVHLTYDDALSKYGIDKPDLRSTVVIHDLSEFATAKEYPKFPVFEVCVLRGAMFDTEGKKAKLPDKLFDENEYRNRKPIIVPVKTEEDVENWITKFASMAEFHDATSIKSLLNIQVGDVIAGSTRATLTYENPTPLGRFRQLSITEFPDRWTRSAPFVGAWVEDFPLFSPEELDTECKTAYPQYDTTKLTSTHHPFTMAKLEHYELLATDPLAVRGEHYDLVINGVELGGGSRRVHDSELQRFIFTEILKVSDPDRLFDHLLQALSMGCPPHAGLALGFDRMCAMLVGSSSIRDVVAFPKTQNGSDMVVQSPSEVSDEVLREYHIKKTER